VPVIIRIALGIASFDATRRRPIGAGMKQVQIVVELRNALVHFKPEWDTQADRHQKLSKKLKDKFGPSPFLNDVLIFPRRWATHGCTSWGVRSCLKFAAEFERLSNLPPKYPAP
jgi:hypothetical protein